MEEHNEMTEEFKTRVADKVADKLSLNYKITNDFTSLIARIEAMNIVVAIINAFLGERQKGENKLSEEELKAIQNAVSIESTKTDNLYKEIEELMKKEKGI